MTERSACACLRRSNLPGVDGGMWFHDDDLRDALHAPKLSARGEAVGGETE